LLGLGRRSEAEQIYQEALSRLGYLVADFPSVPEYAVELARTQNHLAGMFYRQMSRWLESERASRQAVDLLRPLHESNPASVELRHELARSYRNVGDSLGEQGRFVDAIQELSRSLLLQTQLVQEFATEPDYRWELAQIRMSLGDCHARLGRSPEAASQFQVARVEFG